MTSLNEVAANTKNFFVLVDKTTENAICELSLDKGGYVYRVFVDKPDADNYRQFLIETDEFKPSEVAVQELEISDLIDISRGKVEIQISRFNTDFEITEEVTFKHILN